MTDKLKTFIQEHKQELDAFEPSKDLWNKIDNRLDLNTTKWIKSKWFSSLKYFGFSASVLFLAFIIFKNTETEVSTPAIFNKPENKNRSLKTGNKIPDENEKAAPGETQAVEVLKEKKSSANESALSAPLKKMTGRLLPVPLMPGFQESENPDEPKSDLTPVVYLEPSQEKYAKTEIRSKSKDRHKIITDTLFSGVKRLEINGSYFDIKVLPAQDDLVHVQGEIYTESHGLVLNKLDYKIKYEKKDSILIITVEKSAGNTLIVGSFRQETVLNFSIPLTTDVEINNYSGDIVVSGLKSNSCYIKSNYGNVKMTDVQSEVDIKLTSGDLNLNGIIGQVRSEASYGNQQYENITGDLNLKSTSGDIRLKTITGNINVVSSYGDVRVDNSKGNLLINIQSGDIIGKNVNVTDHSQLKTKYGDIKIGLANNFNDLTFDLQSVYGDLKINKDNNIFKSEEGKLHLAQGKIIITGYTQSGDQYYE